MRPAEKLIKDLLTKEFGANIYLTLDQFGYVIKRPSAQYGSQVCARVLIWARNHNVKPQTVLKVIHESR